MRMEEENSREAAEKLQQIGSSILGAARDELYLGMRFLDVALSSFVYQMDSSVSPFGTDGAVIYFHPSHLGGLYQQDRILVNRGYLHLVLHCLFRHLWTRGDRDQRVWNLSCDIAVESMIDQMMFVSATPNVYEQEHELGRAEQIIRPTGLLDPEVEVRPVEGQIDDLITEINKEVAKKNKVLVTTLTKRMAEDLTDYMRDVGIRVKYLHSDIDTLERTQIIRDMRLDVFDVLVGINLLREGLDIPEIALVAILDADKEGFLRSETSLIQTIGRAARNAEGHVIMYADNITDSMNKALTETNRRREIQQKYNNEHGITPTTIKKAVRDLISISKEVDRKISDVEKDPESMDYKELKKLIEKVKKKMERAAAELDFETAIEMRDKLAELRKLQEDN